jgi:CRP-like cAMP-binding protein
MDAYQAFIRNISRFITLTDEEEKYLLSILRITKVRKKQFIVQPEFVCRYKSYVYQGVMRSYLVNNDGQEHTVSLAIDDFWISDFNSYHFQEPAKLFVEALEDSILVQLEYHAEEILLEKYPKFEKFLRIFYLRAVANYHNRMISNLSKTAEERYDEFMEKYPAIVHKVPQYALASYLGMTTQFLSKIRNSKTRKS